MEPAEAIRKIKARLSVLRNVRNYAVSDFLSYKDSIVIPCTTKADAQLTWALYSKWTALCGTNFDTWSSANGREFTEKPTFWFQEGAFTGDQQQAPALFNERAPDRREAKLCGVGQCAYFQDLVFDQLRRDPTLFAAKVSTPSHNWVIANYLHGTDPGTWITVDYWLYALGVPQEYCICTAADRLVNFTRTPSATFSAASFTLG